MNNEIQEAQPAELAQHRQTRRLLRIAKHECGHALVALAFGGTFTDIEIGEGATTDRDLSHLLSEKIGGVIRCMGDGLTDPHYVVTLMAGVAGERVNRKKPGTLSFADILMGAEGDYRDARPICTPLHIRYFARRATTVDRYLNECLASAFAVIQLHKRVHGALVEALLEHWRLTYEDCVEIADSQGMKVFE
jgi:hypothetical protein